MSSKNLFSVTGKYYTQNGAATLYSCGINSAEKGITIAFSCAADKPEDINIWYLSAPGEGETERLYFKNLVDIRVCALNDSTVQNAVRLTGKKGELYILRLKTPAQAQDLANRMYEIGKAYLEANREFAEKLQLPEKSAEQGDCGAPVDKVVLAKANPAEKTKNREYGFQHILGVIMQGIGYLLLLGMAGAILNDSGNTDWSGVGIGIVAMIALIIGGTVLVKKPGRKEVSFRDSAMALDYPATIIMTCNSIPVHDKATFWFDIVLNGFVVGKIEKNGTPHTFTTSVDKNVLELKIYMKDENDRITQFGVRKKMLDVKKGQTVHVVFENRRFTVS